VARCIFHIDLDAFFVSVERVLTPELEGKPVIVGGDPERRGVVASASYEARPFGIYAGMPLSRARCLCPQAIFIQASFPRYVEASSKFMKILADFSPHIEPLGIDEAYLDVTGCEQAYGSYRQLALAMKGRIYKELRLTASVGIAACKVVAKISSDLCKPDGLLEIAPGEERNFLNPLPVAKLPGVGRRMEQQLKQMGITTIGKLASLPLGVVKGQLGTIGVVIHNYANGMDNRRVEAPGETRSISQQITFARDTSKQPLLEAHLHGLCEEVSMELRRRDKQAKCVTLKLRYADFRTITRQVILREASNINQDIFAAARCLLGNALARGEKPIRLIGIKVSKLVGREKQLHMFDPERDRMERLDRAIDKIREKYGQTSIKRGRRVA